MGAEKYRNADGEAGNGTNGTNGTNAPGAGGRGWKGLPISNFRIKGEAGDGKGVSARGPGAAGRRAVPTGKRQKSEMGPF